MASVLVFVEDPGAANYVRYLGADLLRQGVTCVVLADGVAASYLRQHSVEFVQPVGSAADNLEYYRPQLVLVGTSTNLRTRGLDFIRQAQGRVIMTVGLVDALPNVRWRWSGETDDPLAFAPDIMLVPDAVAGEAFVALGYPPAQLAIVGYPFVEDIGRSLARLASGDRDARRRLLPGWKGQAVLGFVSEGSQGLSAKQFDGAADRTFAGRSRRHGRTEAALDEFLDAVADLDPRPYVSVRLHPKQSSLFLKPYMPEIDFVSQAEGKYTWLYSLDGVIGMTSTLLLEAAIMSLPSVSLVMRRSERESLPSVAWGVTAAAETRSEVRQAITQLVQHRLEPIRRFVRDDLAQDSRSLLVRFVTDLLKARCGAFAGVEGDGSIVQW